jgi:hypothetical protein
MNEEILRMIGIFEMATASRKVSKRIKDRVLAGKCLCCESIARQRGLCWNCYYAYRSTKLQKKNATEAARYDTACVRAGKILPAGKVREIKSTNPFREIA